VQALLTVARQRIAPSDLANPERVAQNVMDSREYARVRAYAFEALIAIDQIVEMPRAAFFNNRASAILLEPTLESGPQPRQPRRIDDVGKHNVSLSIESFPLVGGQRRLRDAELGQHFIDSHHRRPTPRP
jgi:hypothetical protein